MKRFAVLALILAACAPKAPEAPVVRDTSRQVYSIAGFDSARISGTWRQVAGFGSACNQGSIEIGPVATYALCLPSGTVRGQGKMAAAVPGRFDLPGIGAFWVLWADADNRTLVIGAPSGRQGMILNREATLPPDRLKAARDILEFNGYDVSKLVVY